MYWTSITRLLHHLRTEKARLTIWLFTSGITFLLLYFFWEPKVRSFPKELVRIERMADTRPAAALQELERYDTTKCMPGAITYYHFIALKTRYQLQPAYRIAHAELTKLVIDLEYLDPTPAQQADLYYYAYGEVGNDVYTVGGVAQRFLYEEKWNQITNDYYFGNKGQTGIFESQYPNYGVTWERAKKFNVGLKFGLFNGMLTGNFDYFVENRNNILTEYLSRPQWVGVTMAAGNLGKTQNKGYELELHHFNHIGKDFTYNIGATFSHAANKIKNMDEPAYKTAYRKREGHPINQYFGLVCEGFVTQADLDNPNFPVSTYGNVKVGDLKYKDMNNDGFIDDRDETFIGYSDIPENTYALTLGANYKGIGFEVMFQGVDHVSRYYDSDAMFAFQNNGKVKDIHLNRWNPAKSEAENLATAEYPLLHYGSNGDHNQRQNSFFLKNGSFVRLKNIELSYTFPKELIKHVGMSNVRFYINANNLFTWDHLDDLVDPESNGSNRYPLLKTVNVGFNVVF